MTTTVNNNNVTVVNEESIMNAFDVYLFLHACKEGNITTPERMMIASSVYETNADVKRIIARAIEGTMDADFAVSCIGSILEIQTIRKELSGETVTVNPSANERLNTLEAWRISLDEAMKYGFNIEVFARKANELQEIYNTVR